MLLFSLLLLVEFLVALVLFVFLFRRRLSVSFMQKVSDVSVVVSMIGSPSVDHYSHYFIVDLLVCLFIQELVNVQYCREVKKTRYFVSLIFDSVVLKPWQRNGEDFWRLQDLDSFLSVDLFVAPTALILVLACQFFESRQHFQTFMQTLDVLHLDHQVKEWLDDIAHRATLFADHFVDHSPFEQLSNSIVSSVFESPLKYIKKDSVQLLYVMLLHYFTTRPVEWLRQLFCWNCSFVDQLEPGK